MKKLLLIVGLPLVLLAALIVVLSLSVDKAIKNGAETFGPKLTGGPVTVGDVSISLLSGQGEISGITIGNPKGFATDAAIRLKTARIALDPKSLLGDQIRIKQIRIDGPEITYETSLKGNNISSIMNNIQTATGSGKSDKAAPEQEKKSGKQLIIDDLLISNGTIRMSATLLKGKSLDLPLPDIHLKDIGKKSNGASIDEVVRQVFGEVQKGVGKAIAKSGEVLGKTTESLKETGKEALDSATEGVKSLFKGLGN